VEIFFRLMDYRRVVNVILAIAAALLIVWIFAYEPVTRNVLAQDGVCTYCHLEWEYTPHAKRAATRPHQQVAGDKQSQATCVQCHLPEGWWNTTYAYLHGLSFTDLFGHFRDYDAESAGKWIPPRAAMAYRVRDRMFETDGAVCRTCHIEDQIKFTRDRGVNAHKLALKEQKTCIECHNNLVHRQIDVRKTAFQKPGEVAK